MSDATQELLGALLGDPAFASGERLPPGRVPDDAACDAMAGVYDQHVRAAARLPVLAAEMGRAVACQRGCDTCCQELVLVTRTEAQLVARELQRPERAEALARFRARAADWLAASEAGALAAAQAFAAGDAAAYKHARLVHGRAGRMCPLNQAGDCTVYEVRPVVCRQAYMLDTAALCAPAPEGSQQADAAAISYQGYERFIALAEQLAAGLQASQGVPARRREPLARAVLRALDET